MMYVGLLIHKRWKAHEALQEIQQATASEPLSLMKEYSMQQTWKTDADRLTFISCTPPNAVQVQGNILATEHDAFDRMLGDLNLLLTHDDDKDSPGVIGEVELMIASKQHQGQGYGRASLLAFLKYILDHDKEILQEYSYEVLQRGPPSRFMYLRVKIGEWNHRSIGLFESLGFGKVGEVTDFDEVELRLVGDMKSAVDASWRQYAAIDDYRELQYVGGD